MNDGAPKPPVTPFDWRVWTRKDALAGLLFIAFALVGLWESRDYPIGTALRMGTGYVPRLLCWILFGLGVIVLVIGLRSAQTPGSAWAGQRWQPLLWAPASLVAFAFAISRLGVVVATVALTLVAAVAARDSRPLEVALAALALAFITVAIFVWGLGLPLQVWPEW
jgi:hypothetical protein